MEAKNDWKSHMIGVIFEVTPPAEGKAEHLETAAELKLPLTHNTFTLPSAKDQHPGQLSKNSGINRASLTMEATIRRNNHTPGYVPE